MAWNSRPLADRAGQRLNDLNPKKPSKSMVYPKARLTIKRRKPRAKTNKAQLQGEMDARRMLYHLDTSIKPLHPYTPFRLGYSIGFTNGMFRFI